MMEVHFQKELQGQAGVLNLEIDFNLEEGRFYALMGESGAGKTSILKAIAGLMKPDEGFVRFKEHIWFDSKTNVFVKPQLRKVGYVFQDYALFPNMTVGQNLKYALTDGNDRSIITEILDLMDIGSLVDRRPIELSGGQQQRVALARAILRQPDIVLLDEPLSALDLKMRRKLQDDLKSLHRHYGFTTLLVTHDESEVGKLADEVFILEKGRITQKGHPLDILNPAISLDDLEGEILSIDEVNGELILSNAKGVFKVRSAQSVNGLQVGKKVHLRSNKWLINE